MSRTGDLAYRVANEPDTLTDGERATVAAMRRSSAQRAQQNALDKAEQQAALGNRPTLVATTVGAHPYLVIKETWRIMSRTHEGHAYYVELWDSGNHIETSCTCPATGCCWHRASARLARQGALPFENEACLRITRKQPAISAAEMSGKA